MERGGSGGNAVAGFIKWLLDGVRLAVGWSEAGTKLASGVLKITGAGKKTVDGGREAECLGEYAALLEH